MCDYSLASYPNRLAREGDELIVYRFSSGAKGLTSLGEWESVRDTVPVRRKGIRSVLSAIQSLISGICESSDNHGTVVCIPHGARLLLRDIPASLQTRVGVIQIEEVTFTQTNSDDFTYRDAVRFRNGREISLQLLNEGQRVRVLNLSSNDTPSPEMRFLTPAA